jgi:hypothetical protein
MYNNFRDVSIDLAHPNVLSKSPSCGVFGLWGYSIVLIDRIAWMEFWALPWLVKITRNMSSKFYPILFQSTGIWFQVSGFNSRVPPS